MKREARDFRETAPKPVKRIPLEIKNPRLRLLLVITALVIAAGAFFFAFRQLFQVDAGWTLLEADGASGITAAGDFNLRVELGAGQETPLAERRRLTTVYTTAAREVYTLYTSREYVAEVNNLWYINHHPGDEIELDARLYRALEKSLAAGRWIFLGPVYEVYDSVYFSSTDPEAALADPVLNPETASYLSELMEYLRDDSQVSLSLLGGNRVRLNVSDAWREFCEENDISRILDFGWQQNAYAIDDLAETLAANGMTRCVLSSRDGFVRCLDERQYFELQINTGAGGKQKQAAAARYRGPMSVVSLQPIPAGNRSYGWRYSDGMRRTAWVSPLDGQSRAPAENLLLASAQEGCADLLNRLLPLICRDEFVPADMEEAAAGERFGCAVLDGLLQLFGNQDLMAVTAGE